MSRVLIDSDPYWKSGPYRFQGKTWDAAWIGPGSYGQDDSAVWSFARKFQHPGGTVRVHVSADQRYHLYLDRKRIARGPERSDLQHWMYNSYDLEMSPGEHCLVAMVWWCSPTGRNPPPWAQQTHRPGFFLMAEGDAGKQLSTGVAPWMEKHLIEIQFNNFATGQWFDSVIGYRISASGPMYPFDEDPKKGDLWGLAKVIQDASLRIADRESHPQWLLRAAMLPEMKNDLFLGAKVRYVANESNSLNQKTPVNEKNNLQSEQEQWQTMIDGKSSVVVSAHTKRRVILDLQTYLCAYTELQTAGGNGASVKIGWAESFFISGEATSGHSLEKGNRSEIESKYFIGFYDRFHADGAELNFESLWWKSGRYVEVLVETSAEPLMIKRLQLIETGYPYRFENSFDASNPTLKQIMPLALRTLEMCSYETSMDCPYYEQLNYTGDTRIQSLVAMHCAKDDRLVRKSLRLFDWSRDAENWPLSRAPTRRLQVIPPFAMWWIAMVHDYAMYRGNMAFLKSLMPGVRVVIERWRMQIDDQGMVRLPEGWNFVDWVKDWDAGMSNITPGHQCAIIQWHLVYTLNLMSKLETMVNEPLLAQRHTQTAAMLAATAERVFFDHDKGCFADNPEKTNFSQHAQIMALLSGHLSRSLKDRVAKRLLTDETLAPASIYFSHYLFEAFGLLGQTDELIKRLDFWFEHLKNGLYTTIEMYEPSRSDCHAWGAHPVYHYYANILGIKPASFGFEKVIIRPQLGSLEWARGEMIHPKGKIIAEVNRNGGKISLPNGISGELYWKDKSFLLQHGVNTF